MPTRCVSSPLRTAFLLLIAAPLVTTLSRSQPMPPGGSPILYADPASHTTIALKWTDMEGETQYRIERRNQYGNWSEIGVVGGNSANYLDDELEPLKTYSYRIRGWNEAGFSEYSNQAAATTLSEPGKVPVVPRVFASSQTDTSIWVYWEPVAGATGFRLEFKLDGTETWTEIANVPGATNHFTHEDLTPSTRYIYRLRAYNVAGLSGYSSEDSARTFALPPSSPELQATALSYNQIELHWKDVLPCSCSQNGYIGYRLQFQRGAEWEDLFFAQVDVTNYFVGALQPSTEYSFRIMAQNPLLSDWSYVTVKTLDPPPIPPQVAPLLYADTLTATSLRLKWLDVELETEYRLERKNPDGQWEEIATAPANSLVYTNSGLHASTTYAYRIRAANSYGASPYSNEAAAITRLPPSQDVPTLRGAPSSPTALFLYWNTVPVAEEYRLEKKNDAGDWVMIYETKTPSGPFRYIDEGLIPLTPYTYRVGDRTDESDSWYYSAELTVQIPPELSEGLVVSAKALSSTSIELSWQPLPFADFYFVAKLIDGGWTHTQLPPTTTRYIDSNLPPANDYIYIVYARNAVSTSPETAPITVTTPARDRDPISFQSISISDAGVTFRFAGFIGQRFKIQSSSTFAAWKDATGIFILTTNKQVTLPLQPGTEKLFYRMTRVE